MIDLSAYKTLVFDCDGVVLDSNTVKTEAFRQAALPYGETLASELVRYHREKGGVSRYVKFEVFLEQIVPPHRESLSFEGSLPDLEELLQRYALEVSAGIAQCGVASGIHELRRAIPGPKWLIVSGGNQDELRRVFREKNLTQLFDGGIFGSPKTKEEILARELKKGNISRPALFLGDSAYDYTAASSFDLDFVFVSEWTELTSWQDFCRENAVPWIKAIGSLLPR